jgi:hypothetical protein
VTERLRERLADAVGQSNRAISDVAGEYGVAWWTVQRAVVTELARRLPAPQPTNDDRHRRDRARAASLPDTTVRIWGRRSGPGLAGDTTGQRCLVLDPSTGSGATLWLPPSRRDVSR